MSAVVNLVGSTIGAGIVSLPYAFQAVSPGLAVFMMLAIAGLTMLSVHFVVLNGVVMRTKTFGEFAECYGKYAMKGTEAMTAFVLSGVVLSLEIIVNDSLVAILGGLNVHWISPHAALGILLAVLVFPLCMLRTFRWLRFSSLLSICSLLVVIITIIAKGLHAVQTPNKSITDLEWFHFDVQQFLGVAPILVYSLGCQVQVLPIFWELPKELRTPGTFRTIAFISVGSCLFLFCAVGICGVLAFDEGSSLPGDIVKAFPHGSGEAMAIRAALSVSLMLMCPLLVWPTRRSIDHLLFPSSDHHEPARRGSLDKGILTAAMHSPRLLRKAQTGKLPSNGLSPQLFEDGFSSPTTALSTEQDNNIQAPLLTTEARAERPVASYSEGHGHRPDDLVVGGWQDAIPNTPIAGSGHRLATASPSTLQHSDSTSLYAARFEMFDGQHEPPSTPRAGRRIAAFASEKPAADGTTGLSTASPPRLTHSIQHPEVVPDQGTAGTAGGGILQQRPAEWCGRPLPCISKARFESLRHTAITCAILGVTYVLAISLPEVTGVFQVVGATGGCFMFYIYPAGCFLKVAWHYAGTVRLAAALGLLVTGVLIGVVSTISISIG